MGLKSSVTKPSGRLPHSHFHLLLLFQVDVTYSRMRMERREVRLPRAMLLLLAVRSPESRI